MLTAMSLAENLGDKGLVAVSLHPGVIMTNLGTHLDWSTEWAGLSMHSTFPTSIQEALMEAHADRLYDRWV